MSQSCMSVAGQSQFQKHRPPRILQNAVRQKPPVQVRRVRKDVLVDKGAPYYRLQRRRSIFDEVVALSVEGVSISAISRVEGIVWNSVALERERAAHACRRVNQVYRLMKAGMTAEHFPLEFLAGKV